MNKRFFLVLILVAVFLPYAAAENCGSNVVINIDCNMATQLIDTSNNPVLTASCDANLFSPDGLPGFINNSPQHWESGIYLIESDANFSSLGIWIFSISCIDGGDLYFGTTEFNVILSDADTQNPNNCEIEISAVESKKTNALIFSASGFNSTRDALGLSPMIDIFDLDSGLKTINQATMSEESEIPGLYTYYFTGVFQPSNYGILVSFDSNCSTYGEFKVDKMFLEERQLQEQIEEIPEGILPFWGIIVFAILIGIVILFFVVYNKYFKGRFSP